MHLAINKSPFAPVRACSHQINDILLVHGCCYGVAMWIIFSHACLLVGLAHMEGKMPNYIYSKLKNGTVDMHIYKNLGATTKRNAIWINFLNNALMAQIKLEIFLRTFPESLVISTATSVNSCHIWYGYCQSIYYNINIARKEVTTFTLD